MKCRADVALGVVGGYFLGRSKKIKFALILASAAAGLRSMKPGQRLVTGAVAPGSDAVSATETLPPRRPAITHPTGALPDGAGDESEAGEQAKDAAAQLRTVGVDDLDRAEVSATEIVIFSLDGRQYQLDLPVEDAAKLRDSLAPFVAVARLKGGHGRARRGRRGSPRPRRIS